MSTVTETTIPTGTWALDKAHTKVGFAVKHMGVSTVRGEFHDFDGALEVDEDGNLSAYGTVQAASVHTNQEQRDEHLRSADFFDVENYPEIKFESTSIEQVDDENFRIIGDLTIHGVTNEIELDAELGGVELGMQDEHRTGLEITGQLSRKDYRMKFNAALGSGNAVVADKVKLALDVEAIRQDA
ncbi:MAG TPA: YceI family protein [Solirubrobacterales bacterium]|jgi:polyisoprenoid-binding protein YceI|nr:YceI family protein [Solirubrobacterales bacterium]